MSGYDFWVPPRSWDSIEAITDDLRSKLGLEEEEFFPVSNFLEHTLDSVLGLARFEVGAMSEMGNAEGLTCSTGSFIRLREDVYEKLEADDGRARFTAAHEIGHRFLHSTQAATVFARATSTGRDDAYRRSEPQANIFAASLLMPRAFHCLAESIGDSQLK